MVRILLLLLRVLGAPLKIIELCEISASSLQLSEPLEPQLCQRITNWPGALEASDCKRICPAGADIWFTGCLPRQLEAWQAAWTSWVRNTHGCKCCMCGDLFAPQHLRWSQICSRVSSCLLVHGLRSALGRKSFALNSHDSFQARLCSAETHDGMQHPEAPLAFSNQVQFLVLLQQGPVGSEAMGFQKILQHALHQRPDMSMKQGCKLAAVPFQVCFKGKRVSGG